MSWITLQLISIILANLGLQGAGTNSLFNLKITQYEVDERAESNNQQSKSKGNDEARQPVQYSANQLYTDSTSTADTTENLDRYGLSEEDFDWMKKAVQEYRREVARRAGYNLTDEELSTTSFKFGDVVFTRAQMENKLRALGIDIHDRRKRATPRFDMSPSGKWSMPIKYVLSPYFSDAEAAVVQSSIKEWMRQTCITFEQHFINETINSQYLRFYRGDDGCWSYVGKIKSIPHPVSLESPGCFVYWGVVIHEIGHALGLYHEQSRSDRDNYVTVLWNNIDLSSWTQYDEVNVTNEQTFGIPYDYGSVMHYGSTDFQKADTLYTLLPSDTQLSFVIGQRTEISFYDSKLINTAYCNDVCPTKLSCQNGGYTDPRNCSSCRCPDGWGGTLCNQIASGSKGCTPLSAVIPVTNTTKFVKSENYTYHESYPYHGPFKSGSSCSWLLQAPLNKTIKLWFEPWIGLLHDSSQTCYHWVEIRYKKSHVTRGLRVCGYGKPVYNESNPIISEEREVFVTFRAPLFTSINSKIISDIGYYQGFQLNFQLASLTSGTTQFTPFSTTPISSAVYRATNSRSNVTRTSTVTIPAETFFSSKSQARTVTSSSSAFNSLSSASIKSSILATFSILKNFSPTLATSSAPKSFSSTPPAQSLTSKSTIFERTTINRSNDTRTFTVATMSLFSSKNSIRYATSSPSVFDGLSSTSIKPSTSATLSDPQSLSSTLASSTNPISFLSTLFASSIPKNTTRTVTTSSDANNFPSTSVQSVSLKPTIFYNVSTVSYKKQFNETLLNITTAQTTKYFQIVNTLNYTMLLNSSFSQQKTSTGSLYTSNYELSSTFRANILPTNVSHSIRQSLITLMIIIIIIKILG